jgi:hypothetical protein
MRLRVDKADVSDHFPLHMARRYAIAKATIAGEACAVMTPTGDVPPWGQLNFHTDQVVEQLGCPVVLVMERIPSALRRHLIGRQLAFIAPGLEISLPFLLSVYRSRGQGRQRTTADTLRPAAQALFLYLLYQPHERGRLKKELAAAIGFSAMSMTRAFTELESHELLRDMEGRGTRKELWRLAEPLLTSPVKRVVACSYEADVMGCFPISGEGAIEHYTDLIGNGPPRLALTEKQWNLFRVPEEQASPRTRRSTAAAQRIERRGGPFALFEEKDEDLRISPAVEIWHYPPLRTPWVKEIETPDATPAPRYADPLSIALLYRDDRDPRVEEACVQLVDQVIHAAG